MDQDKKVKQQPDKGQGSKGNFGLDGDMGKKEKKIKKPSSPVPLKKNNDH